MGLFNKIEYRVTVEYDFLPITTAVKIFDHGCSQIDAHGLCLSLANMTITLLIKTQWCKKVVENNHLLWREFPVPLEEFPRIFFTQ